MGPSQRLVFGEDALAVRPGPVAGDVEHDVVTPAVAREVVLRVVDDVVCADRADDLHVPRAAHAGHFGSERLRDLDGKRADSSGRAVDQHVLPGLNASLVAQALKCADCCNRYGGSLFEGHVRGLGNDRLANAHILGERPVPRAEDFVPRLEFAGASAHRFDRPREVDAQDFALWFAEAGLCAHEVRRARQHVPVDGIHGSRANTHEHTVVRDFRLVDLSQLEDVRRSVVVVDHRFHRTLPPSIQCKFTV
jgi:hypothetical protein